MVGIIIGIWVDMPMDMVFNMDGIYGIGFKIWVVNMGMVANIGSG